MAIVPLSRKLTLLTLLAVIVVPVLAAVALQGREMPHRLMIVSTDFVAGVHAGMLQARQELQQR